MEISGISDLPLILCIAALAGACFGSFANMLIHRLPLGEETVRTPSHCTICNTPLGWKQLIPILSYLLQCGKCHACKARIASRYFWVELSCALLFALIVAVHGVTFLSLVLCAVALTLVIVTAIDLEHMIIPDQLQIVLAVLGIFYVGAVGGVWRDAVLLPLLGLCFGLFLRWLMFTWKKREGLGWGDVKFLTVSGLYLDWNLLAPFCFLSGIMGIITAGLANRTQEGHFAFGPALALALLLCALFPQFIAQEFQHAIDFLVEFSAVTIDN